MKELIEIVWNNRDLLKERKYSDAVKSTLEKLNKGELKVAEKIDSKWIVNEWVKTVSYTHLTLPTILRV